MKTILSTILSAALTSAAFAQVPSLINYQGRLTDADGAALTGTKNFSISIYDAATAGNLLYTESIGAVTLDDNGVYSFQFGSAGTSDTQVTETIGTTAGSTLTYTKTLTNTPVVANSITVTDGTNSWSQSVGNPGVAATATASRVAGFVIGAEITNGGSGYTSAPLVTITGSGSGATATATLTDGVVTEITITNAGSGYSGGATITIAPPVIPFRVDYSGGAITATYSTAAAAGRNITATYRYGTSGITGALSTGAEHWMAISVDGTPQATRQKVLAVPFALTASRADSAALAQVAQTANTLNPQSKTWSANPLFGNQITNGTRSFVTLPADFSGAVTDIAWFPQTAKSIDSLRIRGRIGEVGFPPMMIAIIKSGMNGSGEKIETTVWSTTFGQLGVFDQTDQLNITIEPDFRYQVKMTQELSYDGYFTLSDLKFNITE